MLYFYTVNLPHLPDHTETLMPEKFLVPCLLLLGFIAGLMFAFDRASAGITFSILAASLSVLQRTPQQR